MEKVEIFLKDCRENHNWDAIVLDESFHALVSLRRYSPLVSSYY